MDATTIVATMTPPAEQVPTDFMSYLQSTKQSDYTRLFDFAVDTLSFSTKVNIFHWTCEKGFQHTQYNGHQQKMFVSRLPIVRLTLLI